MAVPTWPKVRLWLRQRRKAAVAVGAVVLGGLTWASGVAHGDALLWIELGIQALNAFGVHATPNVKGPAAHADTIHAGPGLATDSP